MLSRIRLLELASDTRALELVMTRRRCLLFAPEGSEVMGAMLSSSPPAAASLLARKLPSPPFRKEGMNLPLGVSTVATLFTRPCWLMRSSATVLSFAPVGDRILCTTGDLSPPGLSAEELLVLGTATESCAGFFLSFVAAGASSPSDDTGLEGAVGESLTSVVFFFTMTSDKGDISSPRGLVMLCEGLLAPHSQRSLILSLASFTWSSST
mmetsp:Transcript_6938/g.21107  ORF Transcript_6938/g.21107 Transcript_6938/m.21107 type:complete len:210 (+) Transcript_6938:141-770(+)